MLHCKILFLIWTVFVGNLVFGKPEAEAPSDKYSAIIPEGADPLDSISYCK